MAIIHGRCDRCNRRRGAHVVVTATCTTASWSPADVFVPRVLRLCEECLAKERARPRHPLVEKA